MKTKVLILLLLTLSLTIACGGDTSSDSDEPGEPTPSPKPTTTQSLPSSQAPTLVSTPQPIPTETLPPNVTFTITLSHQTTPEDVIRETKFPVNPHINLCLDSQQPTLLFSRSSLESGDILHTLSCGWQRDESVHITIVELSDGRLISETIADIGMEWIDGTYLENGVAFSYTTDLNDPPDSYTFIFEGESGRVERSFDVDRPTRPRLYRDETSLTLHNFQPDERVRIFAYAYDTEATYESLSFVAWNEFQVDSGGQLVVQLSADKGIYRYIALGDISGEYQEYGGHNDLFFARKSIQRARYVVANTGDEPLDVYERESHNSDVIRQVVSDTRMEVIASAIDYDGSCWWQVRLGDETEGWVSDADVKLIVE